MPDKSAQPIASANSLSHDTLRRESFALIGSLTVACVTILLLVIYDLPTRHLVAIVADCTLAVAALAVALRIRMRGYRTWLGHMLLTMILIAQIVVFFGPTARTAIYFPPVITIGTYLILRRRYATIWSAAMVVSLVVLGVTRAGFASSQLTSAGVFLTAQMVVIASVLLYFYEGIAVSIEQTIEERDAQILASNQRLAAELAKREAADHLLVKTLQETKDRNKLLNETQLAMTNVLEDAHQLQQELEKEKAIVERRVEERTGELEEERARLQASIDSLESGFLMTFTSGQTVSYNPALLKIFNLERLAVPNARDESPDSIDVLQQLLGSAFDLTRAIQQCQRTGKVFRAPEITYQNKFLSIFGAPIRHGEQGIVGTVVLIDDITEVKALERSKEEFVAIASHELRTPLTAIRGNASLLNQLYGDKLVDQDMRGMIVDIGDASAHLIEVVNEFLNMSALEQGQITLTMVDFDMVELARKVVADLSDMAKAKGLTITVTSNSDKQPIHNDQHRSEEVLINLVSNAIKYTDKGHVELDVLGNKDRVEVQVTDSGQGIKPEHQGLLFHKFQQATDNILTRTNSRSTGLGLYISKLIVDKMGGQIGLVKSTLGKGSTFSFSLPSVSKADYSKHSNNDSPKKTNAKGAKK